MSDDKPPKDPLAPDPYSWVDVQAEASCTSSEGSPSICKYLGRFYMSSGGEGGNGWQRVSVEFAKAFIREFGGSNEING